MFTLVNRKTRKTSRCHFEHPAKARIVPLQRSEEDPGLSLAMYRPAVAAFALRIHHLESAIDDKKWSINLTFTFTFHSRNHKEAPLAIFID